MEAAKKIAKRRLKDYGWEDGQFDCLDKLWTRESGWRWDAENPSSGAYGIPQSLPGSKMASAGQDWKTNAATQIKWGLGYIQQRYQSPCGCGPIQKRPAGTDRSKQGKTEEHMDMILADSALKGLRPDPAWDVAGVRDMVGGVIAVALVLCVGVIILGCVSLIPGLISNNQMERAFSWKRLLAAMLVPFVIGAAVSGWSWSCNLFGSNGLQSNRSYTQASGSGKTDLKDKRGKGDDGLTGLVKQLGDDIVSGIGDSVKSAVRTGVRDVLKGLDFVTGKDGKGNIFQKAGNGIKDGAASLWKWITGE